MCTLLPKVEIYCLLLVFLVLAFKRSKNSITYMLLCNCSKFAAFSYQIQCNTLWTNSFVVPVLKRTNNGVTGYLHFQQIGLFSYPIHCCMGLFGIESITFFGSTLLRTCFASCVVLNGVNSIKFSKIHCLQVVLEYSCLKNQQIGLMCFYFLAINWKVLVLSTYFASSTLLHWCKVHHI